MSAHEPFEARYSLPKMLGWTALATGMVALSFPASGSTNSLYSLGGWLGIAFFGTALLSFLTKLFDRRVQLQIADNSFFLRPHSSQRISLRSIKRFGIRDRRVIFFFYKPSKYPIESPLRRVVYKLNGSQARDFFGDAWMWTAFYDCTADDIMDAVNAHIELTEFEKDLVERKKIMHAALDAEAERNALQGDPPPGT